MSAKNSKNPDPGRFFKAGFAVVFVLIVSFFVVKSCVHPKKSPYAEAPEYRVPFFSEPVKKPSIVLAPRTPEAAHPSVVPSGGPRLAIILDDWGKNYGLLQKAVDLKRPITIAVIPHLPKSKIIAETAHKNGLEVMLHLPMEPKGRGEPLEPTTILTTMTEAEILKRVDAAVDAVPYLDGVNNHQGSAATSDLRVMRVILKRLKAKKLFFIDSHVVATTQGLAVARETGIRFGSRQIFIDNENQVEAIKRQLEKAKRSALTRGEAIAIGHDRRLTLQAIQEMLPAFDEAGVHLVFARDIVKVPAARQNG